MPCFLKVLTNKTKQVIKIQDKKNKIAITFCYQIYFIIVMEYNE